MKPLPDKKGVLLQEPEYFGAQCFSAEAVARFPELAARLVCDAGQIHLQMGALASVARDAIESDDFALASRLFAFLSDTLARERLHHEVENAIAISFLEPSEFEQPGRWREALRLLPETLKRVLRA